MSSALSASRCEHSFLFGGTSSCTGILPCVDKVVFVWFIGTLAWLGSLEYRNSSAKSSISPFEIPARSWASSDWIHLSRSYACEDLRPGPVGRFVQSGADSAGIRASILTMNIWFVRRKLTLGVRLNHKAYLQVGSRRRSPIHHKSSLPLRQHGSLVGFPPAKSSRQQSRLSYVS